MTRIQPQFGNAAAVSTSAAQAVAREGVGKLFQNLGQLSKHYGGQMLQDHQSFKANALILSSLILVLSRMVVSYGSAQQAKGTPEEQYRRQEFIRTALRESMGWTLSFMVLRAFQYGISKAIRKVFDVKKTEPGSLTQLVKESFSTVKNWLVGKPMPAPPKPVTLYEPSGLVFNTGRIESIKKNDWVKKLGLDKLFEKLPGEGKTLGERNIAKLSSLLKWAPILLASIPAIYLSGYWLEKTTVNHSKAIVNSVNQFMGGEATPAEATAFTMPESPQQHDFVNFMSSVYQKRMERGMVGAQPLHYNA